MRDRVCPNVPKYVSIADICIHDVCTFVCILTMRILYNFHSIKGPDPNCRIAFMHIFNFNYSMHTYAKSTDLTCIRIVCIDADSFRLVYRGETQVGRTVQCIRRKSDTNKCTTAILLCFMFFESHIFPLSQFPTTVSLASQQPLPQSHSPGAVR